jgi:hypothetical protein
MPQAAANGDRGLSSNSLFEGRSLAWMRYHIKRGGFDIRLHHLRSGARGLDRGGVGIDPPRISFPVDTVPVRDWQLALSRGASREMGVRHSQHRGDFRLIRILDPNL